MINYTQFRDGGIFVITVETLSILILILDIIPSRIGSEPIGALFRTGYRIDGYFRRVIRSLRDETDTLREINDKVGQL